MNTQHTNQPEALPSDFYLAIKAGKRKNLWVKASRLTNRNEPRYIVTRPHSSFALYLADDIQDVRQWIKDQA